jgi:RND family efflux transporter MFP subunit
MRGKRLIAVAVMAVACGRGKGQQLPPAQGEGAPAMPALPNLAAPAPEATAVVPTEGRTTGTTYPKAEAQLGPNTSGVIAKILVNEGDPVRKGMVVFRLDDRDGRLRVEQARAAREAAQVNLRAVQTEYDRTKPMFDEKAVNRMQWDQLVARLDGAKVAVQQADVALAMAEKLLADAAVRSPIDGVVTAKLKSEGEMATTMPATVVLVIQDQSVLELRLRLPEHALGQVKVGDVVTARFDALNAVRPARVTRINQAVDARTHSVEVVAQIPNPDLALKSGLLASVELKPREARPQVARPEATRPGTASPETAKPETAKPETTRPEVARP